MHSFVDGALAAFMRFTGVTTMPNDQVTVSRELLTDLRDAANECLNLADSHRRQMLYSRLVEDSDALLAQPAPEVEPTAAMIDAAVAFALNVSLSSDYTWSQYMRDLWLTMAKARKHRK